MIIRDLTHDVRDGRTMLRAAVDVESVAGVRMEPWFNVSCELTAVENAGDPWTAALLVPAMYLGEQLQIEAPVSSELMKGIDEIQNILTAWHPCLRKIEVLAEPPQTADTRAAQGIGCFFSGGADAWYTLLKHQKEVSHLVLVRGFDIPVDDKDVIWAQTAQHVKSIAQRLNKRVIEVSTNIRSLTDMRRVSWTKPYDGDFFGRILHGSSLAAIALSLQGELKRMYVSATYSYAYLESWGSHPLLDPLWSTRLLQVVHEGVEANRMQKIRRISECEAALNSLRVCYENREGAYNCCRCEKCVRTMMALRACGALERATTFNQPLDLRQAVRVVYDPHVLPWYRTIIHDAKAAGDTELVRALEAILGDRFSLEQSVARLRKRLKALTPASIRPAVSFVASRQRWRSRFGRLMAQKPQTV